MTCCILTASAERDCRYPDCRIGEQEYGRVLVSEAYPSDEGRIGRVRSEST